MMAPGLDMRATRPRPGWRVDVRARGEWRERAVFAGESLARRVAALIAADEPGGGARVVREEPGPAVVAVYLGAADVVAMSPAVRAREFAAAMTNEDADRAAVIAGAPFAAEWSEAERRPWGAPGPCADRDGTAAEGECGRVIHIAIARFSRTGPPVEDVRCRLPAGHEGEHEGESAIIGPISWENTAAESPAREAAGGA